MEFIPVKFNIINGHFYCFDNKLNSLEFCPNIVKSKFDCSINQLTSLEFYPSNIGGYFLCTNNKIKNYFYFPEEIEGSVYLNNGEKYTFEEAYKIHLKDKTEYEKQLLNESLKKSNNIAKNNNLIKI